MNAERAEGHRLAAARLSYRGARDLVVLVAANCISGAPPARARGGEGAARHAPMRCMRRRSRPAQSRHCRRHRRRAGRGAAQPERQRATAADERLREGEAPAGARDRVCRSARSSCSPTTVPTCPLPQMTLDEALERAYAQRPDYLAAQRARPGRRGARRAGAGELLPSVARDRRLRRDRPDAGVVRCRPSTSTGSVDVPLFEGGRTRGRSRRPTPNCAAAGGSRRPAGRDLLRRRGRRSSICRRRRSSCRRRPAAASSPTSS